MGVKIWISMFKFRYALAGASSIPYGTQITRWLCSVSPNGTCTKLHTWVRFLHLGQHTHFFFTFSQGQFNVIKVSADYFLLLRHL